MTFPGGRADPLTVKRLGIAGIAPGEPGHHPSEDPMSTWGKHASTALLLGALGSLAGLSACSGAGPSSAAPAAVEPAASATTAVTSPSASPTPTPTPVDLKAALITAKDLGGSWERGGVAKDRGAGECHKAGLPGAVDAAQVAWGDFAETKGAHKAIMDTGLVELDASDVAAYGKAVEKESNACTGKSVYGWYVVSSTDDPPTVDGAEVVASYRQRMYADKKHTQFLYVRQGLVLNADGTIVHIDNAFVPESSKDKGKSFEPTLAIAEAQLSRLG